MYTVKRNISTLEEIIEEIPENTKIVVCSMVKLKSLKGIDKFPPSVKILDVSWNNLTDIEHISESHIEYMKCADNHIVSLKGVDGSKLKKLQISSNKLDSLEYVQYSIIEKLYFGSNFVTSLKPIASSKIKKIACFGNPCYIEFSELNCDVQKIFEKYDDSLEIKTPEE
jgi:Leucine-rich repeat (LRR) protein